MRNTEKNKTHAETVNNNIAESFLKSPEHRKQKKDIEYTVREENGKLYLKIFKDEEELLDQFLDKIGD